MRVNVYAEELTDRFEVIRKEVDGVTFTGLRFYLELPVTKPVTQDGKHMGYMHHKGPFEHRPGDDDSSAVTFWSSGDLRQLFMNALDWNRLAAGDIRALDPAHQWAFDAIRKPAAVAMEAGWKQVCVNGHFEELIECMSRADRKGYMPDALRESWDAFQYRDAPPHSAPEGQREDK